MRIVSLREIEGPYLYSLENGSRGVLTVPAVPASLDAPSGKDGEASSGSLQALRKTVARLGEFTQEELRVISELRTRDLQVRGHEDAHIAAGGAYIRGSAGYSFQSGPDGKSYAIGGEVQIDLSPEETPEATIQKMRVVRAAALAPSDPSAADSAIAAAASQIEASAYAELISRQRQTAAETYRSSANSFRLPGNLIDLAA
jgi:hypothetical protein